MRETTIYFWTDRAECVYALVRTRAGHWHVEWGHRDPPGGDNYVQEGHRLTSIQDDAVQTLLEHIRALSDDPTEVSLVEPKLRAALESSEG